MDDPLPSWGPALSTAWIAGDWLAACAGLSVIILSLGRRALEVFSRTRLLETLPSSRARARFEAYFERLEYTQLSAAVLRATAEIFLILGIFAWIQQIDPFELPEGSTQYLLISAVPALLFLVAVVHVVPRAFVYRGRAETIVRSYLPLIHHTSTLILPLLWPLTRLRRMVERMGSKGQGDDTSHVTEGLLSAVEESEREGVLDEEEAGMIESIMEFRDVAVSEIMTPRTDMISVDAEASLEDVMDLASREGPSRIPVYEGNHDKIIGIFYVKDLIPHFRSKESSQSDLRDLIRPAYFIPETKKIGTLLKEFKKRKVHIAVILDEYGGTTGLVTIEDILEEIVGEIVDEYDSEPPDPLKMVGDNGAEVDAKVHLDEINEALGIQLPDSDDFDTIGGFIFSTLGKIPRVGETFVVQENVEIQVLAAEDRRILRVFIRVLEQKA